VIAVAGPAGIDYYGRLTTRADFEAVVEWATACARDGVLVPLPETIAARRIDRFRPAAVTACA
jgi:hypothetical protein